MRSARSIRSHPPSNFASGLGHLASVRVSKISRLAAALMDNADRQSAALYCSICPLREMCGGLHCKASPVGCEEFCCGQQQGCTVVCPGNPNFLEQFAEVGGFDLNSVPRSLSIPVQLPQSIVPLIYHGSKRSERFSGNFVALRMADLIDFRGGHARYRSREHLCRAFKIDERSSFIVSGVDHDPIIERIWALGRSRARVYREIAELGVACATTPNFSMILDVPRSDNLHAMQRIAVSYSEMCDAGLPTALHVNGRTDHDFYRWSEFLAARSEIQAISYEFITGSGLTSRIAKHVKWLNQLPAAAGRSLVCVLRGNPASLDLLTTGYSPIYIEATSFVKTIKRQVPVRFGNGSLRWRTERTAQSTDLAEIYAANVREIKERLGARYDVLAERR